MPDCSQTVKKTLFCAFTFCLCPALFAASVITTRPDDPQAVYLNAFWDMAHIEKVTTHTV